MMLEVFERLGVYENITVDAWIMLSHGQRDKGRLKAQSSAGDEVHIFLDRGTPLMIGEVLRTSCGKHLGIEGAPETVVVARSDDWETFSRACYHLGNRHVKVEIGELWLRMLPDHVLEHMLKLQGLTLQHEISVFQPESGAYSGLAVHHH